MKRSLCLQALGPLALALAAFFAASHAAEAQTCVASDFAAAVDQSGASLRAFNREAQPKLQDRMRRYAEVKKLPASGSEDAALDAIQDAKLAALDAKSGDLLLQVDKLGRIAEGATPDCSKLDVIKTQSRDLLAVMKEKSDYMIARLENKISEAGGGTAPAKDKAQPAQEKPAVKAPAEKQVAVPPKPAKSWSAATKPNDAYSPPATPPAATAPPASSIPPVVVAQTNPAADTEDGYTIEEIRDATRGFFGTISTNLASVIEHAFKTTGTADSLRARHRRRRRFPCGLRFGQGTLYMRSLSGTRPVYWHGPSLGTDFGASGIPHHVPDL